MRKMVLSFATAGFFAAVLLHFSYSEVQRLMTPPVNNDQKPNGGGAAEWGLAGNEIGMRMKQEEMYGGAR